MKSKIFFAIAAVLLNSPASALTKIKIEGLLTLNQGTGGASHIGPSVEIVSYNVEYIGFIEPGFTGGITLDRSNAFYSVFGIRERCGCNFSGGYLEFYKGRLNNFAFSQWDLDEDIWFKPGRVYRTTFWPNSGRQTSQITGRFDWFRDTTPVPEISTWASMIVGFGVVGAVRRMRRARTVPKTG